MMYRSKSKGGEPKLLKAPDVQRNTSGENPTKVLFFPRLFIRNPYLDYGDPCELEWVLQQEEEVRAEVLQVSPNKGGV